jgi:hypothetical protein
MGKYWSNGTLSHRIKSVIKYIDCFKGGNEMFYALVLNKQRQTHCHLSWQSITKAQRLRENRDPKRSIHLQFHDNDSLLMKAWQSCSSIHLLCMKEQDRPCAYDVTLWDLRLMFMPPRQSKRPCTISSEEALMAILCRRQQKNVLRYLCKMFHIFARF